MARIGQLNTDAYRYDMNQSKQSSLLSAQLSLRSGTCSLVMPPAAIQAVATYTRLNPDMTGNRARDQLRKMGYGATFTPLGKAR